VFAGEDIPWGKKIKEYGGAVIGAKEAVKRIAKGAQAIMELGHGQHIDGFDGGNGAAFINHSRKHPNCFLLRGKTNLTWPGRRHQGGEELTYDYGSDYYGRKVRTKK
jgi:hypothetical protein